MVVATRTRPIEHLVRELQIRDVEIWLEEKNLRTRSAKDAITPELREEIKARRTELLTFLRQAQNGSSAPAIQSVEKDGNLPLSFAQQGIWFLAQMGVESAFNFVYRLRLQGPLNQGALQQALTEIVRRHATFRTTFMLDDGGTPQQYIQPEAPISLPIVELQHLASDEHADEIRQLVQAESSQRFDLENDRLIRAKLVRLCSPDSTVQTCGHQVNGNYRALDGQDLAPIAQDLSPEDGEEHLLLLAMNHIAFDGWSVETLRYELEELYNAFVVGDTSPLPELPIQYVDFASWQRQQMQGEILDGQLSYWKQQLAGVPQLLQLPTDRARPPYQSYRGSQVDFALDSGLTAGLRRLSQQSGTTLFMTLLAAFQVLLYRYTEQDDFVIGTVIANRQRQELESLIGLFVNTLALRANLGSPDDELLTFRELLARVRQTTHDAYEHQDLPFERLVDELQVERSLSHNALVQVAFAMQNTPLEEIQLAGLATSQLAVSEVHHTRYDLELHIFEVAGELRGTLIYSTDLLDEATIERMAGHLKMLLGGIVANPNQAVAKLPMLTEPERHQLIVKWNNTVSDYPREQCVHQLFEMQAEHSPDSVALVFETEDQNESVSLTYRELNLRANKLAHYLQAMGVGQETLIGICMKRSADMIVSLLGILKLGAAYVPLDISYPEERMVFMIEDAQAPVLLTEQEYAPLFTKAQALVICLDSQWYEIDCHAETNLDTDISSDSPAYIIYTSGSTGIPKGVKISHKAINRLLLNTNYIDILSTDHIAQASNASFDAATFEIWGALVHGATLVGIPRGITLEPQKFASYLREQEISILFLTTALFNQVVRIVPDAFATLRYLLFGGEAVDPSTVRTVLEHGSPTHLLHVYGPTESTTYSTWYPVQSVADKAVTVPIGSPLANTQIYVLDNYLTPVPIGIAGELYIGGDGLAIEYHNRPELTAEKFVPNPFGPGKLYKTGDVVRWQSEGNIEFIGRIDAQVKIRGFRIELGEIEVVLTQHPQIQETIVIAHTDENGQKRLVAYVVMKEENPSEVATDARAFSEVTLRTHLKESLPDYMVPAAFVFMDALPITPNGKIDRRALPTPEHSIRASTSVFMPPSTPEEIILAEIWSEILGVEKVGIHDNFFELGGDSIIGIQIASRAQQSEIHLKPRHLFEAQTLGELARAASSDKQPAVHAQATQGLVAGAAPLLPIQSWFFEHHAINSHHFNLSLVEMVDRELDRECLITTIVKLLQHHDALRFRYTPTARGWHQQYDALSETPITEHDTWQAAAETIFCEFDLSGLPADEQQAALKSHNSALQASLNIMTGPIARIAHFVMGPNQPDRVLFIIHHLAMDLVSWRILLPDFWMAYDRLVQQETVTLPAKSSSFREWGEWLHEYAQSDELRAEMDYWLSAAQRSIPVLPVDNPETTALATVSSADEVSCELSLAETQALLQEVPAVYQTQINDLLLTALAQTIAGWTDNSNVLIDLEGHGREALTDALDISRTVGWFTSIFPVSLQLESEEPGSAIKSIKEQLRQVPQRGIGYGLLRYLNPETAPRLAALPKAEISFNYGGQFKDVKMESLGDEWSKNATLGYRFNVIGAVVNDQLSFTWSYSQHHYRRETVAQLVETFINSLRALILHCQAPNVGGFTPSDFADIDVVEQVELDSLLATINIGLEE